MLLLSLPKLILILQGPTCHLGKASHTSGALTDMENRTIYANSGGMSSITSPIAIKDSVTSFHWSDYILETHSDAIESLLQCQSIAIFEGWHYTVYDETLQTCYFGMVKTDKTVLEISDDSNR